jgi:hypothetical protein
MPRPCHSLPLELFVPIKAIDAWVMLSLDFGTSTDQASRELYSDSYSWSLHCSFQTANFSYYGQMEWQHYWYHALNVEGPVRTENAVPLSKMVKNFKMVASEHSTNYRALECGCWHNCIRHLPTKLVLLILSESSWRYFLGDEAFLHFVPHVPKLPGPTS